MRHQLTFPPQVVDCDQHGQPLDRTLIPNRAHRRAIIAQARQADRRKARAEHRIAQQNARDGVSFPRAAYSPEPAVSGTFTIKEEITYPRSAYDIPEGMVLGLSDKGFSLTPANGGEQ